MNEECITIVFKNGEIVTYRPEEYTDYSWRKEIFVVIKDKQWIGLFSWDQISFVTIGEKEE